jgi:hypothetical protein
VIPIDTFSGVPESMWVTFVPSFHHPLGPSQLIIKKESGHLEPAGAAVERPVMGSEHLR